MNIQEVKQDFKISNESTKKPSDTKWKIQKMIQSVSQNKAFESVLMSLIEKYAQQTKNDAIGRIVSRIEHVQSDGNHLLNI